MWKLIVGFIIFAAIAVYVLTKSGGNVDLGGEKHDVAPHAAEPASAPAAAAPASAAMPAASAASQ